MNRVGNGMDMEFESLRVKLGILEETIGALLKRVEKLPESTASAEMEKLSAYVELISILLSTNEIIDGFQESARHSLRKSRGLNGVR